MRVQKSILIAGLAALVFLTGYIGNSFLTSQGTAGGKGEKSSDEKRIVSLAPSITEILFSLGQGDHVVGVTRFCNYPPEAHTKANIGGYFDLSYEAVVELEPTLIIMLAEHVKAREYFSRNGYQVLVVNHLTMEGILESIEIIGKACECEDRSIRLIESIQKQIEKICGAVQGKSPKRTMIAVDRSKPRSIEQIYIAGNDGFFDKMIQLAGGVNVYKGEVPFPAISAEGILQMDPQIIIELVPKTTLLRSSRQQLLSDWDSLGEVDAIKSNRVFLLTEDYVSIPGPRFILTLQHIADLLQSEDF